MEEKEILVRKEESCKHAPKFGRGTWGNHESKVCAGKRKGNDLP